MAWKKTAKNLIRKGARFAKKRYTTKKGGVRMGKIAKDVMMLKSVLNPEKKYKDSQVITTATNLYPDDPFVSTFNMGAIAKGDDMNQRNGNSIKLSSIHFTAKIIQNGSASKVRTYYRFYFVQMKGAQPAVSRANICDKFLERSPLDATRTDFTCHRAMEHMTDFKIIGYISGSISSEQISGYNEGKTITLHKKFQKHVRWDTSNNIQEGEIYIIGIADRGTDASNDGLIVSGYNCRVYWYDN